MTFPNNGPKKKKGAKTPFVILGILSFGPGSGYKIKKDIDRGIGFFWNESYGQLYPALKDLLAKEWIVKEESDGAQRTSREKTTFQITNKGREALQGWISEEVCEQPIRDELLLKTFLGSQTKSSVIVTHLQKALEKYRESLEKFTGLINWLSHEFSESPHLPYWLITADRGYILTKAKIEWAEKALSELGAKDL